MAIKTIHISDVIKKLEEIKEARGDMMVRGIENIRVHEDRDIKRGITLRQWLEIGLLY